MQGSSLVIDRLNRLLTGELTSADQYLAHARMYADWGYRRLAERIGHEREEELDHARRLIDRILFLEGKPDLATRNPLAIGSDVPSMLANDLAIELSTIAELKSAIVLAEQEKDFQTRHILRELLADTEEDHTRWLEQQLGLIKALGLPNYLQSAAGDLAGDAS
ncbi:MAG: bacterioferritin [Actinomycetota bacterium]